MRLFSGIGDKGTTILANGKKIAKNDPLLNLIGSIDELNSFIGSAICEISNTQIKDDLQTIQNDLSRIMGIISGSLDRGLDDFNITHSINFLERKIQAYGKDTYKKIHNLT